MEGASVDHTVCPSPGKHRRRGPDRPRPPRPPRDPQRPLTSLSPSSLGGRPGRDGAVASRRLCARGPAQPGRGRSGTLPSPVHVVAPSPARYFAFYGPQIIFAKKPRAADFVPRERRAPATWLPLVSPADKRNFLHAWSCGTSCCGASCRGVGGASCGVGGASWGWAAELSCAPGVRS